MRAVACAIVCWCIAGPVPATTLYRCVAPDGAVAYQDVPCEGGSLETRQIAVRVEAEHRQQSKATKRAKSVGGGKTSSRRHSSTRSGSRAQARHACAKAREKRDAALAQAGLRRTFEQLRALDDGVYEACKGL